EFLDLVYLDDSPGARLEPVVEEIGRQIEGNRVGAFGVRNWDAKRLAAAQSYGSSESVPRVAAGVTAGLALAAASAPLGPEYVSFDRELRQAAAAQGLVVFAHAADVNIGQCLYGDEDSSARFRRHWIERWRGPANEALVERVRSFAPARGLTTREV